MFGICQASFFEFLQHFACLKITDEGSIPEMRLLSIVLLLKSYKNGVSILEVSLVYTSLFVSKCKPIQLLLSIVNTCDIHRRL